MWQNIYPWLLALRFKTLTAAFVPVVVGTALAYGTGVFYKWWVTLFALGGAFSIQIATNLLNDAIDFKKGADKEDRIGPKRVTQGNLITSKQVFAVGFLFLLMALGFGIPLVMRGGLPIVILGLVSLFLAYGYTGGPFPLAYLGLGDLFVILFFGLFAVVGTFYLHALQVTGPAIVAGLQVGFLATILIAINNLRDSETDVKANKKTLAVRFGDGFVKGEILVLMVAIYLLSTFYFEAIDKKFTLLTLFTLPVAYSVFKLVKGHQHKKELNKALALSALLQLSFGVILSVGFLV